MMKQNDSFAEPRFPVRSYGKGELAMYYLPGIAQQTAVNRLNLSLIHISEPTRH